MPDPSFLWSRGLEIPGWLRPRKRVLHARGQWHRIRRTSLPSLDYSYRSAAARKRINHCFEWLNDWLRPVLSRHTKGPHRGSHWRRSNLLRCIRRLRLRRNEENFERFTSLIVPLHVNRGCQQSHLRAVLISWNRRSQDPEIPPLCRPKRSRIVATVLLHHESEQLGEVWNPAPRHYRGEQISLHRDGLLDLLYELKPQKASIRWPRYDLGRRRALTIGIVRLRDRVPGEH